MRGFLLASCPILIWCISAAEMLLLVLSLRDYLKTRSRLILCVSLITLGLFLDALIISLGSLLHGGILAMLSRLRFISHGLLIPLLFPICAYSLGFSKVWCKITWGFALILSLCGLAEALATELDVQVIAGVTRYTSVKGLTPAWASGISSLLSFGTVIPLMIAGIVVWFRKKTSFVFLAGFLMFAFSALGPATGNADLIFYVSMFGEILMILFLYLFSRKTA